MRLTPAILAGMAAARQVAGVTITYTRGEASVELTAAIGKTAYEQEDGSGVIVRRQVRDYLVLAADLVLDETAILPTAGDRITEVSGAATLVFEVAPLGAEPPWRYMDPDRTQLRIHVQQVSS